MCRLYEKFASYFSSYKWSYYWAYPTGQQEEEDGKTLVRDKRDRAITCVLCRDLLLTLMLFGLLQKDLFKGEWTLAEGFFKQTYCHACHTSFAYELDYETVLGHESWPSSLCNHLMANKRRDSVPKTLSQCSSIQPRPSLTLNLKMANCHSLDVMLVNLYCLFTEHYRHVWGPQFPSAILQSMQKVFGYQATPGQNLPWPQNVSKQ